MKHFKKLADQAIKARFKGTGRPFVIGHFVTNRCMCNCASCLWKHNDWEDVPLHKLKSFYSEAAEEGFLATAISGGEPFLRKDLSELVKFVKEDARMGIMLFTTGWFLKERMDHILPHVAMLMLSLDSSKAEKHDKIRGLPGLFNRLMEAVDLVKEKYPDLSAQFNTCVQKGIKNDIDDLIQLTEKKNMKISFDVITEARHGERGSKFTQTDRCMNLAELQEVAKIILKKKQDGAPIINSERYFQYFIDGKPGYKCHLPKLSMLVDGRGYIEDCLNLDNPIANIREIPLKDIMELPRFKQLRTDAEKCCSCNSPTMIDLSLVWENPNLLFEKGGISV